MMKLFRNGGSQRARKQPEKSAYDERGDAGRDKPTSIVAQEDFDLINAVRNTAADRVYH